MIPGDADQQHPFRRGPVPKVLTAIPIAALCLAVFVQRPHDSGRVEAAPSPQASPSVQAAPAPPAPALNVAPVAGDPASVSTPPPAAGSRMVTSAAATWSDVPIAAQAAYQRAATVIDSADTTCHLDWSLLAGIGKVESDHGRTGGSTLSSTGLATPSIIGPALDGSPGVALIADTDGGTLDGDNRFDHAVGPMQILPATWTTIGVDADGDGQRNPEDIDDAALAAAVYLCSGTEDLAVAAGQRAALLRYNHSTSYGDTVLAHAAAYHSGAESGSALDVSDLALTARQPAPIIDQPDAAPHHAALVTSPARALSAAAPRSMQPARPLKHDLQPDPDPTGDPTTDPTTGPTDPSGPSTEPAEEPATADQLTGLCRGGIDHAYPDATAAARQKAVDLCVKQLTGSTLSDASGALDHLIATLPEGADGRDGIGGLEPDSPEPVDPSEAGEAETPAASSSAS